MEQNYICHKDSSWFRRPRKKIFPRRESNLFQICITAKTRSPLTLVGTVKVDYANGGWRLAAPPYGGNGNQKGSWIRFNECSITSLSANFCSQTSFSECPKLELSWTGTFEWMTAWRGTSGGPLRCYEILKSLFRDWFGFDKASKNVAD